MVIAFWNLDTRGLTFIHCETFLVYSSVLEQEMYQVCIPESKSLMSGARLDRDTVNAAWQQQRNCREWSSLASSTRYCEICLTYSSGLVLETPVLLSLTKSVQIGGPPTTTNNLFSAALPDHNNGNRRRQRTRNQAASVSVQLR